MTARIASGFAGAAAGGSRDGTSPRIRARTGRLDIAARARGRYHLLVIVTTFVPSVRS